MLRVFAEGTAFFVNIDGLNPFALYGQRGDDIQFIAELENTPKCQSELRNIVMEDIINCPYFLDTVFMS